jgi:hypothetical protein
MAVVFLHGDDYRLKVQHGGASDSERHPLGPLLDFNVKHPLFQMPYLHPVLFFRG